jgi:serine/threonine protein kinase
VSRQNCVKRGKWTLGSKIGAGSFGVVHVGMNHLTGTLMAVKCIHLSHDTDTMEDVQREMDLMKSLHHVNIVRYMGVEMDRDKAMLYIFQEWVPGGSVSSLLSKFGPFPIPVVRSYLHQIILGLQYLHSKHILHRDIKGGNVLVNDSGVVKLADFGASKMCAPESSFGMDEEPMTMRGTPYFMAVEVFEEKYGRKADIWSCAGVAFQMITAQPPWKDLGLKSPMSLYRHLKATEGPPPMDEKLSTSLGADIMNLLTTCFDRDASKRPSASDLLEHKFFLDVDKEEELSDSSPTPNRLLQSPPWISPKGQFYSNGIVEIQKNKENVSLLEYDTSEWPEWAKKGLFDP